MSLAHACKRHDINPPVTTSLLPPHTSGKGAKTHGRSHRPHMLNTALMSAQEMLVVELRRMQHFLPKMMHLDLEFAYSNLAEFFHNWQIYI